MLTDLRNFLGLFDEATDVFQTDSLPTLPRVIPTLQQLEKAMKCISTDHAPINTVKQRLLNGLRDRFNFVLSNSLFAIASMLDPNIKLSFTDIENTQNFTFFFQRHETMNMVNKYFDEYVPINTDADTTEVISFAAKLPRLSDFAIQVPSRTVDSWKEKLEYYLQSPKLANTINCVDFWFNNANFQFEIEFVDLVLEILSCPSSSASVERLFSLCGLRTSNRRNRTKPKTLEKMVHVGYSAKRKTANS